MAARIWGRVGEGNFVGLLLSLAEIALALQINSSQSGCPAPSARSTGKKAPAAASLPRVARARALAPSGCAHLLLPRDSAAERPAPRLILGAHSYKTSASRASATFFSSSPNANFNTHIKAFSMEVP